MSSLSMLLTIATALLLLSSQTVSACNAHSDCGAGEYCDDNNACFDCSPYCLNIKDAIDGCCPCDSSCVATTLAPAVRNMYQFTFLNAFSLIDDKDFFKASLEAHLKTKTADRNLRVVDVYLVAPTGSSVSTINPVVETTANVATALRVLINNQTLGFTYTNLANVNTLLVTASGSLTMIPTNTDTQSKNTSGSGGSSNDASLVPVIVVVVIVIVILICVAIFAMHRTRSMTKDLSEARMASYDETDTTLGLVANPTQLSLMEEADVGYGGNFSQSGGVIRLGRALMGESMDLESDDEMGGGAGAGVARSGSVSVTGSNKFDVESITRVSERGWENISKV